MSAEASAGDAALAGRVAVNPDLTGLVELEPGARESVPWRNVIALWLLQFGIGIATLMPSLVALPVVIAQISPENKDAALGMVLGVQAFLSMALVPFFGALSDRSTWRWGMRKPGIALGAAAVVVSLFIYGASSSMAGIWIGVVIGALGSGAATASGGAIIPDSVPQHSRGRILGFTSLVTVGAGLIAAVIGPMFLQNQLLLFGFGAVVLAVLAPISLVLLRDRKLDRSDVPPASVVRQLFEGYRFNPRSAPDYSWVFASRFVITLGIALSTSFAVYFLTDQLKVSSDELPGLLSLNGVMSLGVVALGTIVGAFIADRARSRKAMVLTVAILMAVGAVTAAFSPNVAVFFVGGGLIYFAVGLFIPTDGALVMAALPGGRHQVGKFMAIITIADQLPRSIGPMVAPAIIALGAVTQTSGYPLLYVVAGVVAIIGGLIIRKVKGVQ